MQIFPIFTLHLEFITSEKDIKMILKKHEVYKFFRSKIK
jgi:hypothetical protein